MRNKVGLRLALPLFAAMFAVGHMAPAAAAAAADLQTVAVDSLKPGQYRWSPGAAPRGRVEVVVSIPEQIAYVYRAGTLIGLSTVSTGAPGYDTPTGEFSILQKKVDHKSNLYDDAPMPYMQRLTWDGVALHAGKIPGRPASHGCVRLPAAFAKLLYSATTLGATVRIVDEYVSTAVPQEAPLEPIYETDLTAAETNALLKRISAMRD